MARSMWTGNISFGLVNVPVKLYSAVSHKEVRFNMLHEKDGARIRQKRVCSKEDVEVPWDEIAKGYQVSPHRYVMVTREELESFDPKATRSIDINDFVDLDEIDPIFYESAYYLAPDKGADKSYALLLEAMRRTNKVGIARVVLRTKQYLCAVRPMGEKALGMSTLLYADEVVSVEDIEPIAAMDARPADRELKMAVQLVEALSAKWDPAKYTDEYRERVLEMLERKAQGEEIVTPEEEAPSAKVVNLADALQASLRARGVSAERGEYRDREGEERAAARRSRRPSSGKTGGKQNGSKGSRTTRKKKTKAS